MVCHGTHTPPMYFFFLRRNWDILDWFICITSAGFGQQINRPYLGRDKLSHSCPANFCEAGTSGQQAGETRFHFQTVQTTGEETQKVGFFSGAEVNDFITHPESVWNMSTDEHIPQLPPHPPLFFKYFLLLTVLIAVFKLLSYSFLEAYSCTCTYTNNTGDK